MQVKFKKLRPDAITPTYATDGSAGLDFYLPRAYWSNNKLSGNSTYLTGKSPMTVHTGISVEIPEGYAMLLLSRSGHGIKHAIRLANCVGLIDADYRGEIVIKLSMDDLSCYVRYNNRRHIFNVGDRIAQGVIVPVPKIELVEVDELSETARGEGGFGSTGK